MTMRERGHTPGDHAGSPHPRPDSTAIPAFGDRTANEQRFVASYRRRARNPLPPLRSEDWTWQLRPTAEEWTRASSSPSWTADPD